MNFTGSFGHSNSGLQSGINTGTINAHFNTHADPLDKLPIAHGAELDSFSDQHEVECLQGTRTDILRNIAEWAVSPQGKCIFWLNGMAGTGKSTIARTVAASFNNDSDHLVVATFFFKRGEGNRGNATMFFPTISRQLARRIPALAASLKESISIDPDIPTKSLREQFKHLLLLPLQNLEQASSQILRVIVIIDALDECEPDKDIRVMLQLLPQVQELSTVRLRIFLTSRPELPIRLGFSKIPNHQHQDLALHDIPEEVTSHDISLFLKDRFRMIQDEKCVPEDWPGDDLIRALVDISVPLFISAATICRFLEVKLDPVEALTGLIKDQAKYATRMDKTYLPVLVRLLDGHDDEDKDHILHHFRQIIGLIVILAVPLSVNALSRFLELPTRLITNLLDSFGSVLNLPSDHDLPVRILHLSFRDFLLQTKSEFHVNEETTHKDIAVYCIASMRAHLKKNICNLEGEGIARTEIVPEIIKQHLRPELQYSCRYWVHHLEQCADGDMMTYNAYLFLQDHFLHWVETMSLLGVFSQVVRMINTLQMVTKRNLKNNQSSTISDFLHDAKRFILKNHQIASETPLQIYCAGLVFAPAASIIFEEFQTELPSWINKLLKANKRYDMEIQTLEGHSAGVRAVAFSPDSALLASGSDDNTVRLWDSTTGALQQTLEGHSGRVTAVAFSPDGRLLASGSEDETVQLWDPYTGTLKMVLEEHSAGVTSLAFSPDGRLLASGSATWTVEEGGDEILLWDPATGLLQRTLKGVSYGVTSLAFSPNGQLLASALKKKDSDSYAGMDVQLWDPVTGVSQGALQSTFEDDSDEISSVDFSPDGCLLAYGSHIVQLWDPATRELQKILESHSGLTNSVAFSPDGRFLASGLTVLSGSENNYVELWDPATGTLLQTLKSHPGDICSVAFSPNSQLLASGSDDRTIRLWDTAVFPLRDSETLQGHREWVKTLAFSPDGHLLASGSNGTAICLWDSVTCTQQHILEGHTEAIDNIVFSPNGLLLASTSDDNTIRLWDLATGGLQQTLDCHSEKTMSVAFSPDNRLIASACIGTYIRLWDTATGSLQWEIKSDGWKNPQLAFSPGGKSLACSSMDQIVRLWDPVTGVLQRREVPCVRFNSFTKIFSVAFSPDGQILALVTERNVELWNSAMDTLHQTLKNYSLGTCSVAFSNDGRLLASVDARNLRVWDTATGTLQEVLEQKWEGPIIDPWSLPSSVAFSPNGKILASTTGWKNVQLYDPTTGVLQQILQGNSATIKSLVFSPSSDVLASISLDSTVQLWDPATGTTLQNILNGHEIAFSPGSQLLASASQGMPGDVNLWDPVTGVLQKTLKGHSAHVFSVAFSPNSQLLASASRDMTVRLWDPATGILQKTLHCGSADVTLLAFSPDSQLLACRYNEWNADGNNFGIQLWNLATGTLQQTIENHPFPIYSMTFSPVESLLVWTCLDVTVKFFEPAKGALQQTLESHSAKIRSMAFSSDGQILALGLNDGAIQLWNPAISALRQTLKGHSAAVGVVAHSADGYRLASGSDDRTIRLWTVTTGELQQIVSLHKIPSHINFSQDGLYLNTDVGLLHLQSQCNNSTPASTSSSSQRNLDISIDAKNWISIKNKKALRIPVEFSPTRCATYGNMLALGHQSGQVSIMGFHI